MRALAIEHKRSLKLEKYQLNGGIFEGCQKRAHAKKLKTRTCPDHPDMCRVAHLDEAN